MAIGLDRHTEKIPSTMGDERHFRDLTALGADLDGIAVIAVHSDHIAIRRERQAERAVQPAT